MRSTLAQALDLVLPALSPALAGPEMKAALRSLATQMAPIARGGFECRLHPDAPQVDLQQCISARGDHPALLLAFLSGAGVVKEAHPGWRELLRFLQRWADYGSGWSEQIIEIWLEFDQVPAGADLPLPALFLALHQRLSRDGVVPSAPWEALDLVLGGTWWPWRRHVARCFAACGGPFVSHIGVMLSRGTPALRINVKRLQRDTMVPFLREVSWSGDAGELLALAAPLFELVEKVTVCLDVGEGVMPRIGLECIIEEQPDESERWARWLDYLVARGLCALEKRAALLAWRGHDVPIGAPAVWPDALIVQSLLQPPTVFSVIDRRLGYVKLSYRPHRPPEAKAYIWFGHTWASVSAEHALTPG